MGMEQSFFRGFMFSGENVIISGRKTDCMYNFVENYEIT